MKRRGRPEGPPRNLRRRKIAGYTLVFDEETSVRMAGVRQRGTSAERIVRSVAYRVGLRYSVRNRNLPGSPDLANRREGWAVFVHGCFWHRHAGCSRTTMPKRNRSFWLAKFEENRRRDRRKSAALRRMGFRILIVWECEALKICKRARLERKLVRLLSS